MTLSDRRRLQLTDRAADHLAEAAVHLSLVEDGLSVLDRIRQAMAGPAAQRSDTPRVGGHRTVVDETGAVMPAVSDPTGERAVALADRERWAVDRAANLLAEVDRLIVRLDRMAERLVEVLSAYPPAHSPSAVDVAEVNRDNARSDGCQNCATIRDSLGRPMQAGIDSRRGGPTDADGRLAAPMWLCSWCYDRLVSTGRLPNDDELRQRHLRGRNVPWPADVPRPA